MLGCNKSTTVNQYSGPPTEEPSEPPPEGEGGQGSGGQVDPGGSGGSPASGGTAPAAGSSAGGVPSGAGSGGSAPASKKYVPELYFEGNNACVACIQGMSGKLNGSGPSCDNVAGCLSSVSGTIIDNCDDEKDCLLQSHDGGSSWGCALDKCYDLDSQTSRFWECVAQFCATACEIKVGSGSPPWICP